MQIPVPDEGVSVTTSAHQIQLDRHVVELYFLENDLEHSEHLYGFEP